MSSGLSDANCGGWIQIRAKLKQNTKFYQLELPICSELPRTPTDRHVKRTPFATPAFRRGYCLDYCRKGVSSDGKFNVQSVDSHDMPIGGEELAV